MSHSSYRVVCVILVSLWSAGCSLLPLFEPGSPDVIPDPLRADDSSVTLGAWLDSEEVSKKASDNDAGQMLSAPGYEPTNNKQGGHDNPRDSVSVRLTVIESYQQLLPLLSSHGETRNNAVRGQTQTPSIEALEALIEQRLAELKMSVSEAVFADDTVESNALGQIKSPEIPSAFDAAIQVYQDLIAKYPDHPSAPSHWYQLAKGLEMVARREESIAALSTLVSRYPESEYVLEAYFRLGEHFFREGQFDRAHQAFSQVVERVEARLVPGDDPEVSYYPVAKYMVGWSEFKQQQTDEALVSFIEALDIMLKPESIGQSMTLEAFRATLPETRQSLILDLFRVIAIGIDNLPEGAPNGLTRLFDTTGEKPYEHLVYEWLATGYLEKQRFFDAVAMYQEYIHRYPNAYPSPVFQKASVDVLEQAGFYEDAWSEKATFVSLYGHGSLIWAQFKAPDDGPVFPEYLNTLNGYLKALAKHQHYHAQQAEIANRQEAAQFYRKAIRYYEDLLRGFPEDAQRSEFSFFLGDSYFALEEFPRAIEAFKQVAYGYPLSDFSADAGFNVLHAFERQVESVAAANTVAVQAIQAEQLDSSAAFITHFEADSRRGEVTKKAMALALSLKDYLQAVTLARQVLAWTAVQESDRILAWTTIAQSYFAQNQYQEAESALSELLAVLPERDQRRTDMSEMRAAAIYKQAELALQAKDRQRAVQHFLRLGQAHPNSSYRIMAEYDAAALQLELQDWSGAIITLQRFSNLYPRHKLALSARQKLVYAHEQQGDLYAAALALLTLSEMMDKQPDMEEGARLSLLQAARYFDRADRAVEAIQYYRQYAHGYPDPLEHVMEARAKLSEIYNARGEVNKRKYWLNKIVQDRSRIQDAQNQRLNYLLANAYLDLADYRFEYYRKLTLTTPLRTSLKQKKQALNQTIDAYNRAAEFGFVDQLSLSQYKIAEVYRLLAIALLESERPGRLNEVELMEYELLLEEQAYPFEEKAIDLHESNARRVYSGRFDEGVQMSFKILEKLLPVRYHKSEAGVDYGARIH